MSCGHLQAWQLGRAQRLRIDDGCSVLCELRLAYQKTLPKKCFDWHRAVFVVLQRDGKSPYRLWWFTMTTENCSDLLDLVYAINQPRKTAVDWQAILERMRRAVGADFSVGVARFPTRSDRGEVYSAGLETRRLRHYQCDTSTLEKISVLHSTATFPAAQAITRGHPLFHYFAQPYGIQHGVLRDCLVEGGIAFRLFFGRWSATPVFSPAQLERVDTIGKHLTREMEQEQHQSQLRGNMMVFRQLADDYPVSTLVLDAECAIRYSNQRAREQLADSDYLSMDGGRLAISLPQASNDFQRTVRAVLGPMQADAGKASEAVSLGPYQLLLRRVAGAGREPLVVLHLFDSDATPTPDKILLKKLFHLTNAETRLAVLLAQGRTIDDATGVLGISKHTARTHLRSMFVKCGVSRQANLVQKIVTSAAMLH